MRTAILLGDSIRLGYQAAVAQALPAWRIAGPEENCRSSRDLEAMLDGGALAHLEAPALAHVNAGLHDLGRNENTAWLPYVPIDDYRRSLVAIVERLIAHPLIGRRRLIIATTTPVDGQRHNVTKSSHRHIEDVVAYNLVLCEVAAECGAAVNDLFAVVEHDPDDLLSADGVHFTPHGYAVLGRRVAGVLAGHPAP